MNYSVPEPMAGDDFVERAPKCALIRVERDCFAGTDAGYSRETVLLSCLGLLIVLLAVTAFVSRMYHKSIHVMGDEWFAKGEEAFRGGNPVEAAKDYRNALVYSQANTVFQLHLAEALTAIGLPSTDEQAQSYLLNLLAESPGSGEINLELARIAARQKNRTSAQESLRYYYGAIYGVWEGDPLPKRWDARRELCEYLLAHGLPAQAQPEAVALARDVPGADFGRRKQAAALLMRAGLWDRALNEYRAILPAHKHDADVLEGAGLSAFQLAQYARAVEYLNELPHSRRAAPEVATPLALSREVEATSPFLSGLSPRERAHRATVALAHARMLTEKCLKQPGQVSNQTPAASANARPTVPASAPQNLEDQLSRNSRAWTEPNFIRHPDQMDAAMKWAFDVENAAAQSCGPSQNLAHRALLLIAKSRTSPGA